jgi:hypothetical protein
VARNRRAALRYARETEGKVFHDEELIAHLERVAASEDDLPREDNG